MATESRYQTGGIEEGLHKVDILSGVVSVARALRHYCFVVDTRCGSLAKILFLIPEHGMRRNVVKGKRWNGSAVFRSQIGTLF